jgi:hypothetical protein
VTGPLPAVVAAAVAGHRSITIRRAEPGDRVALRRLEGLSDRRLPAVPLLVAVIDGALVAAAPERGGEVVSDPFTVTLDAVELLRLRAEQLQTAA